MIITTDNLKPSFYPLRDWKTQKGVRAEIVTVGEINALLGLNGGFTNATDRSRSLQIKSCIKHYHDVYNTQFVLLGGESSFDIPTVCCRSIFEDDTGGLPNNDHINGNFPETSDYKESQRIPTDLFYSCLPEANEVITSLEWDNNDNGDIGELSDGPGNGFIDFTPDVFVGRIPVQENNGEITWLDNWIYKTIAYEKYVDFPTGFARKLLLCGAKVSENVDGVSEVQHYSMEMFHDRIQPYWNSCNMDYLFDEEQTNLDLGPYPPDNQRPRSLFKEALNNS